MSLYKSPNEVTRELKELKRKSQIERLLETRQRTKDIENQKRINSKEIELEQFKMILTQKLQEFHTQKSIKLDQLQVKVNQLDQIYSNNAIELLELQKLKKQEIKDLKENILEIQIIDKKRYANSIEIQRKHKYLEKELKNELLKQIKIIEQKRSKFIAMKPKKLQYEFKIGQTSNINFNESNFHATKPRRLVYDGLENAEYNQADAVAVGDVKAFNATKATRYVKREIPIDVIIIKQQERKEAQENLERDNLDHKTTR
jgi:hypothetical protein